MKFLVLIVCLSVASGADDEAWIIDGREARSGEYPDLVSLQINGNHFCGGTLVDRRTVVSAAHCFFGIFTTTFGLTVVAGENDLTRLSSPTRKVYGVSRVILHPEYRTSSHITVGDDIAILKLSSNADIGAINIAAVKLEDANLDINTPPSGVQCHVAGWGAIDPSGLKAHTRKMVGAVRSVSNAFCAQSFNKAFNNIRQICAGGETSTDSCRGDSGGPLYCTYNGKTVQAGIVSYGSLPCALRNTPAVYTRVSTYRNFINQNSG